jgi:glutathione S-transferase
MDAVRNGRIPAIIDHGNNDKIVWESGAILLYLAERFDKAGKFVGIDLNERAEVYEWLFFQVRCAAERDISS